MALTDDSGMIAGAFHLQVAKRDSNGYAKGILADPNTSEFSDGIETEVLLYKIVVEGTEETREWRKGCLTEKMDKLAESEEIHLQRFALGLKQGLVTKGLV